MGSSTTDRKFRSTDRGSACSRSRRDAAAAALNDHRNLAAFDTCAAVSRAHEARRFPGALRRSDLLEPPGRRCGCGDVVIFVLAKLLIGKFWFGADAGAQAVDADVGFAGSERMAPAPIELKRGMGSSTTDRENLQH